MHSQSIRKQVEHCIGQLRRGSLTEDDLQAILNDDQPCEELRPPAFRQDLLYLQTRSTAIDYPDRPRAPPGIPAPNLLTHLNLHLIL